MASDQSSGVRRRAPGIMIHRLSGHLDSLLACGAVRLASDDVVELLLNEAEASEGGMVTIAMRVPVRCPACATDTAGPCATCGTARTIDELFSAWLAVPPDVTDGTLLKPSALLQGMLRPVSFRACVRATPS